MSLCALQVIIQLQLFQIKRTRAEVESFLIWVWPLSEWCPCDIFRTSCVSSFCSAHTAHLDLGYIRPCRLFLAQEGTHLRCRINDVGLWMTHIDTKATERFPTATATLGINSRHHAGMAESQTGPHMTSAPLLRICGSRLLPGWK